MSGLAMGTAGNDGAAGVAEGVCRFGGPFKGKKAYGIGSLQAMGQALTTAVHRGRRRAGKAPTTLCIGGDQRALRAPLPCSCAPHPNPAPQPTRGVGLTITRRRRGWELPGLCRERG